MTLRRLFTAQDPLSPTATIDLDIDETTGLVSRVLVTHGGELPFRVVLHGPDIGADQPGPVIRESNQPGNTQIDCAGLGLVWRFNATERFNNFVVRWYGEGELHSSALRRLGKPSVRLAQPAPSGSTMLAVEPLPQAMPVGARVCLENNDVIEVTQTAPAGATTLRVQPITESVPAGGEVWLAPRRVAAARGGP